MANRSAHRGRLLYSPFATRHFACLSPRPPQPDPLPAPIALLLGLALVMQFLALGDGEQQLGAAAFIEIELERDQRHPLAVDRAQQFVDLLSMQQELARPFR